ncbi:hypothetical protein K1T71_006745 [Dendrolimus kikuchii]|uniref:Uncharacterized protein n=1 Tax=Dendrolimus kikuchii TaxID=765133 RepID=A0ACC1D210_9NEOP|nr:hypothetical protein K1T71_006745 [Dendrolimus kikuchii]
MSRFPRIALNQELTHTLSDSDVSKLVPTATTSYSAPPRQKRQRKGSDDQLTFFKDEIREMLDEWKESQNSILNKLVSEVVEIKRQNNEIKNSNQEIEKALEFINAQYEDMKQKVESLEKERNDQKVQIAVLESKLEDMQRVSKASMIEIRNLPIINKPETKGDLSNIVQNTCKALNLVVPQTAIRDVYRLYGKTGKGTIIADFNSVMVKNEVLQGLKAYNKIHSNKRLTSSAIGLPGIHHLHEYLPSNSEDLNRYPISLRRELFINLRACRLLFSSSTSGTSTFALCRTHVAV